MTYKLILYTFQMCILFCLDPDEMSIRINNVRDVTLIVTIIIRRNIVFLIIIININLVVKNEEFINPFFFYIVSIL